SRMKKHLWGCVVVASLVASSAGAVEFFVPVPYFGGGGRLVYETELVREDVNKGNVDFTFAAEGHSGLGLPAARYKVLPGPSTDKHHPLLTDNYGRDFRRPPDRSDPKFFLSGDGLVIMEGEPGLLGVETAVIIGTDPATAWELPMLTKDDAFTPGDTVWVLNLAKAGTVASQLSLFNLDGTPALCRTRLLSATSQLIEERTEIPVPSFGAFRLADILRRVTGDSAAGLSVAVTCDHPFYALGSFPSP